MGVVVVGMLQQSCVDKFVPESLDAFDKDAGLRPRFIARYWDEII